MKKRNSQLIKKWIWVLSALLILPTIALASPALRTANLVPAAETVGSIGDQTNTQGDFVTLDLTAAGAVTYTATSLPTGLNLNQFTGAISGTVSAVQTVNTSVTANNGGGQVASETFEWDIIAAAPPNADPIISSPGDQITTKNENVSFFVIAADADLPADTLTFSAQDLPNGVGINSTTGEIFGSTGTVQDKTVTVKVTDGNGGEDEVTFTWSVKQANIVGNPGVSVSGDRVDGSPENMVINLTDWIRNDKTSSVPVYVTQFSFHAKNANVPITPFVVKVAKDVPITDYDFTVVAVGTTRTTYAAGDVTVDFKDGGQTITLGPGETLLTGFMDAYADGTDPTDSATVALDDQSAIRDSIWLSYKSPTSQDLFQGYSVQVGQAPTPGRYGNNPVILTNLKRNYAFNITFGRDNSTALATSTPDALPTPEPTPDAPWQIKNGSFEEDSSGNGKFSLTHWEVIDPDDENSLNNGVDVKTGSDPKGGRLAIEGDNSLDLNSSTISQTVSGLEIGQPYILRIDYRVESNDSSTGKRFYEGTVADAAVRINGESMGMGLYSNGVSNIKGIHTNEDIDFIACNGFEFVPTTTTATIEIESLEQSNNPNIIRNGVIIDNVHIITGTFPSPPAHDMSTIDTGLGGWIPLVNGDFQELPATPIESIENTGTEDNPHLCGAGLPGWRVTRESIDLVGQTSPFPPGSPNAGNLLMDTGGHGPGGVAQTLTGLVPNETYVMRFYAARHFEYIDEGDMESDIWVNGEKVATVVRTLDQIYTTDGFFLELVEMTADENGQIIFELFSTAEAESGNILFDNFAIIAKSVFPDLTQPDDVISNVGDVVLFELTSSNTVTNPLQFEQTGLPTGLSIDEETGVISGTVTTAGTYSVTVSVNDGTPIASVDFTWIVNTAPVVVGDGIDDQADTDGDEVDFNISSDFDDDDGDDLAFSAEGLPAGVVIISDTGQITGTLSGYGMFTVTVTANDGNTGVITDTFAWDVNANPVFSVFEDQKTNVGEIGSLDAAATDPDVDDDLTYSETGLPNGLNIDPATGMISGTTTTVGSFDVTIMVEDSEGGSDSVTFNWLVNTPPVITTSPADQANNEGDIATVLAVSADDADSDIITYSATNLPPGISINPATGVISGTLTEGGLYAVTVTAEDGNGGSDTATFNWDVNSKPEVTNPGDQSTAVNGVVDLTVTATDADDDTLEFSATGLPTGLSIDSATGKISGTATAAGSYSVVVSAEDPDGLIGTASFSWVVNTPPEFTTAPGDQTGSRGEEVSLTVVATDADGDTITYSATDLPTGLTIDPATGEISGELASGGQWTSTITASDGNGGETSITIFWDIDGIVVPPTGLEKVFLPLIGR